MPSALQAAASSGSTYIFPSSFKLYLAQISSSLFYAEVFDFTVQPQPVNQEALAEAQTRREAADAQHAEDYDRRMHAYTAT